MMSNVHLSPKRSRVHEMEQLERKLYLFLFTCRMQLK
jgi:hypothetical protein